VGGAWGRRSGHDEVCSARMHSEKACRITDLFAPGRIIPGNAAELLSQHFQPFLDFLPALTHHFGGRNAAVVAGNKYIRVGCGKTDQCGFEPPRQFLSVDRSRRPENRHQVEP
ncbi:hypothetical protein, partial [Mesorhizobium sp.]|uniref:hypothetical protein n=1 Tax=Mesorhizobium sp. TaxID=1871066 RepID=UPI0025E9196F